MNEEEKTNLATKKAQLNQLASKIAEMERELPVRDNGLVFGSISEYIVWILKALPLHHSGKQPEHFPVEPR